MNDPRVTVLLVDDDKVDAMAVKRSFRALGIDNPVVEAHNGIEALQRLRGENGHEPVPSPYLILLDLNMPQMGGLEFLAELRADARLRQALVFVMTTDTLRASVTRKAGPANSATPLKKALARAA